MIFLPFSFRTLSLIVFFTAFIYERLDSNCKVKLLSDLFKGKFHLLFSFCFFFSKFVYHHSWFEYNNVSMSFSSFFSFLLFFSFIINPFGEAVKKKLTCFVKIISFNSFSLTSHIIQFWPLFNISRV